MRGFMIGLALALGCVSTPDEGRLDEAVCMAKCSEWGANAYHYGEAGKYHICSCHIMPEKEKVPELSV